MNTTAFNKIVHKLVIITRHLLKLMGIFIRAEYDVESWKVSVDFYLRTRFSKS